MGYGCVSPLRSVGSRKHSSKSVRALSSMHPAELKSKHVRAQLPAPTKGSFLLSANLGALVCRAEA